MVPAFSSSAASSDTLKKYLSVGMLAIALISFIRFFVSRAFLFKYPRTLKAEGEGEKVRTVVLLPPYSPPQDPAPWRGNPHPTPTGPNRQEQKRRSAVWLSG